jgi:hypothetical protein
VDISLALTMALTDDNTDACGGGGDDAGWFSIKESRIAYPPASPLLRPPCTNGPRNGPTTNHQP